ncbi:hypothetical protein NL317_32010, partial [Klebsiella pneumoniae]|nr:hypothetical protein [Klebsiella pneumoniae]
PAVWRQRTLYAFNFIFALVVVFILAGTWAPLGPDVPVHNIIFVMLTVGSLLLGMLLFVHFYRHILACLLRAKLLFMAS